MPPVRGLEHLDGVLLDGLEFCRIAYDTLEAIQGEPNGIGELRLLRTLRAKRLLEEILPIAAYVQARYGAGFRMRVRWRGGNQRYDARLLCSGLKVARLGIPGNQHLEVTTAAHERDYLVREHLHREGGAFTGHGTSRDPVTKRTTSVPTVRDGSAPARELAALVNARIAAKSAVHYPPNTTLVIRCVADMPILDDEWDESLRLIRQQPPPKGFREVVLVEGVSGRVAALFVRRPRAGGRSNLRVKTTAAVARSSSGRRGLRAGR